MEEMKKNRNRWRKIETFGEERTRYRRVREDGEK